MFQSSPESLPPEMQGSQEACKEWMQINTELGQTQLGEESNRKCQRTLAASFFPVALITYLEINVKETKLFSDLVMSCLLPGLCSPAGCNMCCKLPPLNCCHQGRAPV